MGLSLSQIHSYSPYLHLTRILSRIYWNQYVAVFDLGVFIYTTRLLFSISDWIPIASIQKPQKILCIGGNLLISDTFDWSHYRSQGQGYALSEFNSMIKVDFFSMTLISLLQSHWSSSFVHQRVQKILCSYIVLSTFCIQFKVSKQANLLILQLIIHYHKNDKLCS